MANDFSALEREFDEGVRALSAEDTSIQKAETYLASAHAAHRHGSIAWSATPRILNDAQIQILSAAAETCGSIMDKVAKLYLKDASFRSRFGFTPEVEALTLVPTGYETVVPLARVDVDFCGRSGALQVRGISVDGFTGMTSTVEVTRAEQMTDAYRAFAEKHADIEAFDSVDALVQTLRATYRTWANANAGTHNCESPALGIVGYPEEADLDEVADICERFAEFGVFARFVDICNLRVETAAGEPRLVDDDGPIACVYRLATSEEIAMRPCPGTSALEEAARRGLACVIGGFSTWSCATDALFDALRAPEAMNELSDEEMAFIEEHVPAPGSESSVAGERLGLFVFGGKLAGVFPESADRDIMGECRDHVYRGCLVVHE
ncbi:hypothetical protein [Paratractidigestivibacter sp.]|uniref:hypothetical protein n=1 Tax=Paratractidigestivibacter sp. TaxID=2847316 RepID=UPI002ABD446E|nr:hypothetical protein [Paratractidigestivibacter sp.]